jgi:hypothetical protein
MSENALNQRACSGRLLPSSCAQEGPTRRAVRFRTDSAMTPKWLGAPRRPSVRTVLAAEATSYLELFFFGRFFRLVLAKSFNCFSLIDSAICFDAPLREDFFVSPRFAASAAPAAICCFFDFAGIFNHRSRSRRRVCRSCVPACSTKSRHWTIASHSTTCQFTLRTWE